MSDDLPGRLAAALPGYVVRRELSGGGMSRVFQADEPALGRRVVIKVVNAAEGSVNLDRFRREVLLSAQLQHPNIVPVLTAGEVHGLPYFVMPFVEGRSLRARLLDEGPLPVGEAVRLLRNVAAALAYAHARGVVHRDIKPDNIIVSGGVAVVLDFGVAKALAASSAEPREGVTSAGIAIGTPRYMSPEQAAGDPAVDARADLYALGVTAYEMLTGDPPFSARDPVQLLRAHLLEPAPPVTGRRADLPPGLGRLVMRCLEKDRSARPAAAGEILEALDAMGTPSGVRAISVRESARRAWAGTAAAIVPTAVYVLVCVAAIAGLRWLAAANQVGSRVVVLGVIAALVGLPVVVAAGLLMHVRRLETELRAAS